MGKETTPSKLESSIDDLTIHIRKLIELQINTNRLLEQLVKADNAFLGTLTSFLDLDHRLKLDQERKKAEHAKSLEPTKHDLLY